LLFRNCCKRNYVSKDNGQFQKAKLRLRRLFSLQPKAQHYSTPASLRVTKSAQCFWFMCSFVLPTSKTTSRFWNRGAKPSRWYAAASACHPEHARNAVFVATYCSHPRARRSFAEKARCIQRHKSSLLFDLYWPRCTVRSKNRRRRDLIRV